ncbi:MAG: efflux RND transporter permease subunit [Paracoccaceae bacterium]
MTLPALSLRRPVLATVLNLLIVLIGAVALTRLPVRELPLVDTARITVRVDYRRRARCRRRCSVIERACRISRP